MVTDSVVGKCPKPRILLIANTAWYLRNFRASLVERLEAHGFTAILASPPDAETDTEFYRRRHFEPLRFSRNGRNPLIELLALIRLIRLFRRVRPDMVLTWTPKPNIYGAIAGRLLKIPVIPNVSGLGVVFIRGGVFSRLVGMTYRLAFSSAAIVFFQNEEDRAEFIASGWIAPERTERLPGSGVDLDRFKLQPLPPPEPFVFLFMGRLLADKGLRELVEATRRLHLDGHRFELRVAGFLDPGNPASIPKQELDDWIQAQEVQYLGAFEDVRQVLAAAHCVILPSYREGVPRSLLEAAASGRPVITTDVPGCRDTVLSDESGFLCAPRDVTSLASCMERMLDLSPRRLADMGRKGRAYMERNFSEQRVLDVYLHQCQSIRKEVMWATARISGR